VNTLCQNNAIYMDCSSYSCNMDKYQNISKIIFTDTDSQEKDTCSCMNECNNSSLKYTSVEIYNYSTDISTIQSFTSNIWFNNTVKEQISTLKDFIISRTISNLIYFIITDIVVGCGFVISMIISSI